MTKRRLFHHTPSRLGSSVLFLTLIIIALGVVAIYNASVAESLRDIGNKYHFAIQQLKWAGLGLVCLFLASRLPLSLVRRFSLHFLIFCLFLMLIVLLPGVSGRIMGARRWLNIAGFTLQPSELTKLGLIVYLAHWLEKPRPLTSFLLIMVSILGLTMLQPDLGTAIILASTGFILYYVSGAPVTQLLLIAFGGILASGLLIFTSAYRRARLLTYLDPTQDPLGASYHINQILIALGSGGWFGVGLGRGRQKFEYLPEATTDSIFAVIGEELGLVGGLFLVGLLILLSLLCLRVASRAQHRFNQLLASGVAIWLAAQTLLNISAMGALVPLTGIPLPLISYGGSSLISLLIGVGLIINIVNSEKI